LKNKKPAIRSRGYALVVALSLLSAGGLGGHAIAQDIKLTPAQEIRAPESVARGNTPQPSRLALKSAAAVVLDQATGEILYGKNSHNLHPIASITKLMTSMVVYDAQLDPNELVTITDEDVDYLRNTGSRLHVGASLSRDELMRLALMSSENRAAAALSRAYPGGREAFIRAMNEKAASLGLQGTRFADSTGLSSTNVSTAEDLAILVKHAHGYPKIREYSTATQYDAEVNGRKLAYRNTNGLVSNPSWGIGLSKTGFINEAGRCLVMQAQLAGRAVIIVLLDSWGKQTRGADALRVRQWLEAAAGIRPAPAAGTKKAAPKKSASTAIPAQASRKAQPVRVAAPVSVKSAHQASRSRPQPG
jgi:serine-type D-Ala-D-Ala endopeptidase (penicillin-binding protein 7)